jgi:hypothetical protein
MAAQQSRSVFSRVNKILTGTLGVCYIKTSGIDRTAQIRSLPIQKSITNRSRSPLALVMLFFVGEKRYILRSSPSPIAFALENLTFCISS